MTSPDFVRFANKNKRRTDTFLKFSGPKVEGAGSGDGHKGRRWKIGGSSIFGPALHCETLSHWLPHYLLPRMHFQAHATGDSQLAVLHVGVQFSHHAASTWIILPPPSNKCCTQGAAASTPDRICAKRLCRI